MADEEMSEDVKTSSKRPACPHNHDEVTNTIPFNIEAFRDLLKEAACVFDELSWELANQGFLGISPPNPNRQGQGQSAASLEEQVEAQVEAEIYRVFHTNDWTGGRALQDLITAFEHDHARKWGQPDGIWHGLLRAYPEFRDEILAHKGKHIGVIHLVRHIKAYRRELRALAKRMLKLAVARGAVRI